MSDVPDLLSLAQRLRKHDRMPDSAAEVEWAAARIAALQADVQCARDQLAASQGVLAAAQKTVSRYERDIRDMVPKLTAARAENERLRQHSDRDDREIANLGSDCEEYSLRIVGLQAELAGLKDVGDEALVGLALQVALRTFSTDSNPIGVMRDQVKAVIDAIAPALIARERERAAEVCKSIAKQELEAGNYISAAIAKMIEERIRAGAAP